MCHQGNKKSSKSLNWSLFYSPNNKLNLMVFSPTPPSFHPSIYSSLYPSIHPSIFPLVLPSIRPSFSHHCLSLFHAVLTCTVP